MADRMSWALVLAFAGCAVSFSPTDEDYDSELAFDTLTSALEAWKDGNVNFLVKLDSPIRFVDDDLLAGFRLEDFEIERPAHPVKPFQNVLVNLTLKRGKQPAVNRAAQYQISLQPGRAVLRSDP